MAGEVGGDRVVNELKGGMALLRTGGQHRPDAFAPAASGFAACALGDFAVDGQEAYLPLWPVVGRLDGKKKGDITGKKKGDITDYWFSSLHKSVMSLRYVELGKGG